MQLFIGRPACKRTGGSRYRIEDSHASVDGRERQRLPLEALYLLSITEVAEDAKSLLN
jgi:hypothetical protein